MDVSGDNMDHNDTTTKKIKIDNGGDIKKWKDVFVTNEVEYDDGGWQRGYYYDTHIEFYKKGEKVKSCQFFKYLVTDATMYDRVDVFLPGYLPHVRRLRNNDFKFEQVRILYKHTIDLKGIKKLVLRSDLAVERQFSLDVSNESSSVSSGEWITDECSSSGYEQKM